MLALRRGNGDEALKIVSAALQREPEDTQLRYALGFIYMEKGLWAFAEQAFRGLLEKTPGGGEPAAADRRPDAPAGPSRRGSRGIGAAAGRPANRHPALQRFAGQLRLAAGQPEQALPLLLQALSKQPEDRAHAGGTGQDRPHRRLCKTQVREHWRQRWPPTPKWTACGRRDWRSSRSAKPGARSDRTLAGATARLGRGIGGQDGAASAARRIQRPPTPRPTACWTSTRTSAWPRPISWRHCWPRIQQAAIEQTEAWIARTPEPARQRVLLEWLGRAQDSAGRARGRSGDLDAPACRSRRRSGQPLPPTSAPPKEWPALGADAGITRSDHVRLGRARLGCRAPGRSAAAYAEPFRSDRFGPRRRSMACRTMR